MSDNSHSLKGPHFVLSTEDGAIHGEDSAENREIVRRIHACVNACEGISTEELDQGIIQDMRRVISQVVPLLQQRQSTASQPAANQPIVVNNRNVSRHPLQDA